LVAFSVYVSQMTSYLPNERGGVDAGTAICLQLSRCWSGATHRERWANSV